MFPSYLRASLVALVASAITVSAAPGLTVKKSSLEVGVEGGVNKRTTFSSCSLDQQDQLNAAAASAASLAYNAYIQATDVSSNMYRYNRWFGAYDRSRVSIVRNVFESIANRDFTTFAFDCSCTSTDCPTIIDPNVPGQFLICASFWSAPNNGEDSKGGLLVYQSSLWADSGIDDSVDLRLDALTLAQNDPDGAVHSAANYQYFAEDTT